MKISLNWLKDFIEIKQTPDELASLLSLHTLEVEMVEKHGDDFVLDIDVTPNRGDCLSHVGIAREIYAITSCYSDPPWAEKNPNAILHGTGSLPAGRHGFSSLRLPQDDEVLKMEVADKEACPRYLALVIGGIKIKPSPALVQKRLKACGVRPINNIVDATNYVMLEIGQPLHAFDYDKIKSRKMIVRRAQSGEQITTLDNKAHKLQKNDIIIEDGAGKIIDLAGIMGGKLSEVSQSTKTIVLQAATFDPLQIGKTSRRLNQRTEAARIYEYGNDPNIGETALARCLEIIKQTCLNSAAIQKIDHYPTPLEPVSITVPMLKIHNLIGIKIPIKRIKEILKSLGFIATGNAKQIKVQVPTWRPDIQIPEDLIEEIARIYGYKNIPEKIPVSTLIPPEENEKLIWTNKIKHLLKSAGFSEVYNYSFVGEKQLKKLRINPDNHIEIENPISEDVKYMRRSLLPNLLRNVADNIKHEDEFRVFEVGKVYNFKCQSSNDKSMSKSKCQIDLINEKPMLAGVLAQKNARSIDDLFYQAKGVIESLISRLGVMDLWFDEFDPTPDIDKTSKGLWETGHGAEIKIGPAVAAEGADSALSGSASDRVGFIGSIKQTALKNVYIKKTQVVMFDIDLEKLIQIASEELEYEEIPKFPPAKRDLAFLVDIGVKVDKVLNIIQKAGGKFVMAVDLFDMYEGENLPKGKKSLAFHVLYLAQDHTMTDEEVDKVQEMILRELKKELKAEIRK